MKRRDFLNSTAGLTAAGSLGLGLTGLTGPAQAQQRSFAPVVDAWRGFEITTRIDLAPTTSPTRVWVPMPSVDGDFQRSLDNEWRGNATSMKTVSDGKFGAAMLYATFPAGVDKPYLEVTSRVQTRSRKVDWSARRATNRLDTDEVAFWTAPHALIPTDGIVRTTALKVTQGQRTEVEKVRAIYNWVVANTYRDPQVPGCGIGDIKAMLVSGNMGGKCADINALFVGLSRSVGIPARDIYGIRVAPSAFGYKELGAGTANISKAQHCRSEVYLTGYGWVAMDPADVAKVMRQETAEWIKDSDHAIVKPVKAALFGGWEGNWLAYNMAHDVALTGSTSQPIGFCMYPQAENAKGLFDSLSPDTFRYGITAAAAQVRI